MTIRFGKVLQQLWIPETKWRQWLVSNRVGARRVLLPSGQKWCYKKGNCLNNCNHTKQLVVVRQVQGTDRLERPLNHHFSVILPFYCFCIGKYHVDAYVTFWGRCNLKSRAGSYGTLRSWVNWNEALHAHISWIKYSVFLLECISSLNQSWEILFARKIFTYIMVSCIWWQVNILDNQLQLKNEYR